MKIEDAFKIQTEMKLLEGGYYDEEVWKYVNVHKEEYEKRFSSIIFKKDIPYKSYTGKTPDTSAVRMWWFKEKLHPELFK